MALMLADVDQLNETLPLPAEAPRLTLAEPPPELLLLDELDAPPPELPDGIEHSFTDLERFGSEPHVATEQQKLPLNTLYPSLSAAPKATLVDELTEQVCPVLQIVT